MSKLTGVKTLDMVNGEITKVAYNGAEYERVEGTPRSVGKSGDLVLNGHRHPDLKLGGFYLLVRDEGTSRLSVRDEIDDFHGNAVTDGDSILFRKVSASQPSLEDRVSTNEKDIESLKSDVAALKGEAKTEYVRIDKSEAKAGDFVKFDEAPNEFLTAGKYYEIYRVDGCGDPQIRDDDGDGFDTYCADDFEVYRKVSAAEPKPERLKVGDYAKVVRNESGHYAEIDEIVLVKRDDKDFAPFHCEKLNGNEAGIFYEDELVRATDEEVAEAKRAAAERKKWAAIGREVGEYKAGDMVQYLYDGEICEVLAVGEDGRVKVATQNHGNCTENQSSIELIAPVEARFDRKGDE
ncbi:MULTISPECIES: hypothetical protein [Bacillus]|uniref:hypothetical protein n=1 Tax=Bacillus TaxID=1386 RepID=UPI00096A634F|nr:MULTISPECIES: hypothetical protein [Bacillus]AWV40310.1 hypothetical protein CD200_07660 [Bacillus licheniformis]AZN79897.1 hypothetical protein CXG95_12645 [Bacillus licheniformis]QAW36575.1 hypothetical protein ETK49_04725 [Bacillus licheniformis]UNJ90550.1 hypothetical protein MN092_06385 [Bacillus licheniformis]